MRILLLCIGLFLPTTTYAFNLDDHFSCAGFLFCGGSSDIVAFLSSRTTYIVSDIIYWACVFAFLYGGLRMTMSQGEEGKDEGKKAMTYGLVGYVLAVLTISVINTVYYFIYEIS